MTLKQKPEITETEQNTLQSILSQREGAMSLECVDGFFCALICSPNMPPVNSIYPQAWGEGPFNSVDEIQTLIDLFAKLWNRTCWILLKGETYYPIMYENESGVPRANEWAQGFLKGTHISGNSWEKIFMDNNTRQWIEPIMILAIENDPDPKVRSPAVAPEEREDILINLVVGVKKIYDYFTPHRIRVATKSTMDASYR